MEKIREFVAKEVKDWDDEVVARVRFKDFSGQRRDWETIYGFWRDLILNISIRFDILLLRPSEVRNEWFTRRGLTPLCLASVLVTTQLILIPSLSTRLFIHKQLLMRSEGHLLRLQDRNPFDDSPASTISAILRKVGSFMTSFTHPNDDDDEDVLLAVVPVLKDRADRLIRRVTETCWTSTHCAVLTIPTFNRLCGDDPIGLPSSSAIMSFLCSQRKARCVSFGHIQGVKISLSSSPVTPASTLDSHLLHLISTAEMLQNQLFLLHQRSLKSRESALASLNSGNKTLALRHLRAFKLANQSRETCDNLLNRVEQVLNVIAAAESTKMVSEAIQIGAQAIKEHKISAEELHQSFQQLDESIDLQKQLENALDSAPSYTGVDDEDVEEEFKKLELEIEGLRPSPQAEASDSVDSLSGAFSKLKVADGSSTTNVAVKERKEKKIELEAA